MDTCRVLELQIYLKCFFSVIQGPCENCDRALKKSGYGALQNAHKRGHIMQK